MFSIEKKIEIINKYCHHRKDCGSIEIQIIIFTFKINSLYCHLKFNKKDYSSRRGLLSLINKRNKLLLYLKKKKNIVYLKLINDLEIK